MVTLKCLFGLIVGGIVSSGVVLVVLLVIGQAAIITRGERTQEARNFVDNFTPLYLVLWLAGPITGCGLTILEEFRRRKKNKMADQAIQDKAEANRCWRASRLSALVADSAEMARGLSKLVGAAEDALDRADREFADGAFAPFWDAVEDAVNPLAQFDATVQKLIKNSTRYKTEAPTLPTLPPFQLGVQTLPDATYTADRMRSIVRRAQKNFQFATIYDQRKTNQLLVAGFSSLGRAINELGERLDSSLERLGSSVGTDISKASEAASSHAEALREQLTQDSGTRHDHEKEVRQMLDNIQRRKKPKP